jgi:hypothetical protein
MSNKKKDFTFEVKETLTRRRLYTVKATSWEDANFQLDGFKSEVKSTQYGSGKVDVIDYEIVCEIDEGQDDETDRKD